MRSSAMNNKTSLLAAGAALLMVTLLAGVPGRAGACPDGDKKPKLACPDGDKKPKLACPDGDKKPKLAPLALVAA
jgi:hypothetical protein